MMVTRAASGSSGLSFLTWWGEQLAALLPRRPGRHGRKARRVVIELGADGRRLIDERGPLIRPLQWNGKAPETDLEVDDALAGLARLGKPITFVLRLPASACFSRTVELPASALRDADNILALDLERATPFRAGDVYTASIIEGPPTAAGKVRARQIIARRSEIDSVRAALQPLGVVITEADCRDAAGHTPLPINLLASATEPATEPRRGTGLLTLLALLCAGLGGYMLWLTYDKYERALAALRAETDRAKREAQSVRRTLDDGRAVLGEFAALEKMKRTRMPAVVVLDEITKLLPDTAWVSEFRIEDDVVELTGLAKGATALPQVFERSAMFADAALSAPLVFDQREERDRFSLKMKLRVTAPTAGKTP
jgi:general secretion pathway protein L